MNSLHQELVKTLIELYTLQIQLGNIAASSLQVPDNAIFNRNAALAAGYTEEAVRFMAYMPYLSSEEDGFEIFPNTFVERYVEETDEDVYAYQALRELDTDPFEGVYIPPSYIKLTKHNVYGSIFLYDTDTGIPHFCLDATQFLANNLSMQGSSETGDRLMTTLTSISKTSKFFRRKRPLKHLARGLTAIAS